MCVLLGKHVDQLLICRRVPRKSGFPHEVVDLEEEEEEEEQEEEEEEEEQEQEEQEQDPNNGN